MSKAIFTILCLLVVTFNISYADDDEGNYDDSQMSESHEEMPHPAMPVDDPPPVDEPVDEPIYEE